MLALLVALAHATTPADEADAAALAAEAREAWSQGRFDDARRIQLTLLNVYGDTEATRNVMRAGLADPAADEADAERLLDELTTAREAGDFATAKARVERLTTRYPETKAARAVARFAAELAVVDQPAPSLEVAEWFNPRRPSQAGRPQLLFFFEAWCPHCKHEAPEMAALDQRWGGKIEVVGLTKVTRSATDESVRAFIADHGIAFAVGKEKDGLLSQAYAVTGIPAAAVVVGGKIVWRGHPASLDEATLSRLVGFSP